MRKASVPLLLGVWIVSGFWSDSPTAVAHDDHRPRVGGAALGFQPTKGTGNRRQGTGEGKRQKAKGRISREDQSIATRIAERNSNDVTFHTVSLAPLANAALAAPDEWNERIWKFEFRSLPRGEVTFAGVPFFVVPANENKGLAAVTLVGGRYKEGPSGGGSLKVGQRAASVYVAHTASYQNINAGRVMAEYTVHYADGTEWKTPVQNLIHIADFSTAKNISGDCVVGWQTRNPVFPNWYAVHVVRLENPHPEKEIASIELRPSKGSAVVSVLGLTLCQKAPPLTPLAEVKETVARPATPKGEKGRIELKVLDGKQVTPARVAVEGPDGVFYQPPDGMNHFMLGRQMRYFFANGKPTLDVPSGKNRVMVTKGFEYRPAEVSVDVSAGKTAKQTVELKRWIDMPARGWYSGEMHIHPFDQEPEDTSVCLLAEDLHVSNLLIWGTGFARRYHSDQFFRGKPEPWPDATHVAYYNEEYRNNTYGHLCLVNLKSLVYPMGSGGEYSSDDYPVNAVIMDRTHEQGGHVSVAHMSVPAPNYATPWEVGVDVIMGKADSIDLDLSSLEREKNLALDRWYRLLNCGFRVPATCGTDSFMNMDWTNQPLGNIRTYARVGKKFSYEAWIKAAKRGRSFVTQGPMLFFTANGKEPGDSFELPAGKQEVDVKVEAVSLYPLKRLEVVVNGHVEAAAEASDLNRKDKNGAYRSVLSKKISRNGSGWIAARAESESSEMFLPRALLAHTSPVYCEVKGRPLRSREDATFFVGEITGLLDWVETKGIFREKSHKTEVKEVFTAARKQYEKMANE